MDRERKYPAVVAVLLLMSLMLGLVMVAKPAVAAGRTLYFVDSTGSPCDTGSPSGDWFSTSCWSLSSGGAVGEPIPTANDDVVFDVVSKNHAARITDMNAPVHDVIINGAGLAGGFLTIHLETPNFSDAARATLTAHSIIATFPGDSSSFYLSRFGDQGQGHFKYTGTISSNVAAPDCDGDYIVGGLCIDGSGPGDLRMFVEYVGLNDFGTAQRTSFADSVAVIKTVYCDPDCTDVGGNTNIVFGSAPAAIGGGPAPLPPASSPVYIVVVGALAIAVIAAILLLASLFVAALVALRPWLVVILVMAVAIYLVFVL